MNGKLDELKKVLRSIKLQSFMFIIRVLIHTGLLVDYWWYNKQQKFPASWTYSYTIFVILMMCASTFMSFFKNVRKRLYLFIFRMIMASILSIPFHTEPLLFELFFILLIFEGFLYFTIQIGISLFIICAFITVILINTHISVWNIPNGPVALGGFIISWSLFVLTGFAGYYVSSERNLREQEKQMIEQLKISNVHLAETNIKLQHIAAETKVETLESERSRITREIHDTVAYTFTNLLSLLDAHREKLQADSQEVPENIIQARRLVREGLGDIRIVLKGLRPNVDGEDWIVQTTRLVKVFSNATGIKVSVNYRYKPQLAEKKDIEGVLYRTVQEGLTNAFRHGQATQIFVSSDKRQNGIELTIQDNGKGMDLAAESGGLGLRGIRERVKIFGGDMMAVSYPNFGYTLQVWIPLEME